MQVYKIYRGKGQKRKIRKKNEYNDDRMSLRSKVGVLLSKLSFSNSCSFQCFISISAVIKQNLKNDSEVKMVPESIPFYNTWLTVIGFTKLAPLYLKQYQP